MKIAFVITNLRGGGAEKAILKTAAGLQANHHEVHLVLLEQLVEHCVDARLTVHALAQPGVELSKGWFGKRVTAWKLHQLISKLAKGKAFDAIISTLPFADEVVALAKLDKVWYRIANTLSEEIRFLTELSARKARSRRRRYQRLYEYANLIAVSDGVARDLREELGLCNANIVRIYNPFDLNSITAAAQAEERRIPPKPYVLHIGRFARQKRHDLLLDAWRLADRPEQLVLMTQPEPALTALIESRGLSDRVTVAGFQQNPYAWIKRARLLVLCSDHEGMPNVLVEALACGTPVVSTDCPSGPREILTGTLSKYLVPCSNAEQLARAITTALNEPRQVPYINLKHFDVRNVITEFETLPARWTAAVQP